MPIGLVKIISSFTFELEFVISSPGLIIPVTLNPYLGSLSFIVWPPEITMPASLALSLPPRNISTRISSERSFGNPTIFNALIGVAPIAYISLKALAADICP